MTTKSTPRQEFAPELVQVDVGDTVVWRPESGRHDTTAYHPENEGRPLRLVPRRALEGGGRVSDPELVRSVKPKPA
ncbi:MAG: cupredoxin domain-containing protein [Halobacteriota archaeon]